jgi:predicted N-acyltransferase
VGADLECGVVDELPPGWATSPWQHAAVALAPARVARLTREAQWVVRFVVARRGGELVGVLPICRPRTATMRDPAYDVAQLVGHVPDDARRWLVIGGCRDLHGGTLVRGAAVEAVRERMVRHALDVAAEEELHPVALYVPDAEVGPFQRAMAPHGQAVHLADDAVLHLAHRDMEDYLGALSKNGRKQVRRDRRQFAELGLRTSVRPVEEVLAEALPLIVEVTRGHGLTDSPRLADWRMRRWLRSGLDGYLAFTVRAPDERLVAACFVGRQGTSLEAFEIGLTADGGLRHPAYLEAMLYAPIEYALAEGVTRYELGLDAIAPKRARGARVEPVWAVHRAAVPA